MIYFERVDRDEIEEIYQINKLAFEHLYNKYHDEQSPFNESISSMEVEAIQEGVDLIYFIKNTKQQVKEF